jgi:hypothetical protein
MSGHIFVKVSPGARDMCREERCREWKGENGKRRD